MQIDAETLDQLLNKKVRHGARLHSLDYIHKRVTRHYCAILTARGLCPMKCSECGSTLNETVSKINPATARYPYALFVWLLRNATSAKVEQQGLHIMEPTLNAFKERVDIDPLALLEKELG